MIVTSFHEFALANRGWVKPGIPVAFLLAAATFLFATAGQEISPSYGKLPLSFEHNRGQAPSSVSYLSRTPSGVVFLRPGSISVESDRGRAIAMRFVGAASVAPQGEQQLPGITSYLVGEKRNWVRGVPNYATVRYASIYPGIDVVFHGDERRLEYDFVLRPGADPDRIRIAFEGMEQVAVDAQGDLELLAAHGTMKQRKPKIWQAGPLGRKEIAGRYIVSGPAEARFQVAPYDRQDTLVIDPVIDYASYFGSNRDDRAQAIATDATGAAYIAGSTTTGGTSWGFVSKVNANGTAVLYTAYIGSGVCSAAVRGIAVDAGSNAIVTGYYTQTDQNGSCSLKQVLGAKINPTGDAFVYELVWGGPQDYGNAVAIDGAGNAYFTGLTKGGFPVTPNVIFPTGGAQGDAFVTKLTSTGAAVYSTYLGGNSADEGRAITVDTAGNAYIAGSTGSSNFPVTANAIRATLPNTTMTSFVTEINSTATQVLYSTLLGGNGAESASGVALDGQAKIHLTGSTTSSNFPTTANAWDRICGSDGTCNAANEDVFYSRIDPLKAGTAGLLYSTLLGGAGRDFGEGIAVDKNGRAWITGRTASSIDFPIVHFTQGVSGGDYDAFLAQIDPVQPGTGSLVFSTFLGGALYDEGTAITLDPLGNVYAAGYTGSTNFPVMSPLQPQSAGGNDGFILKIAAPAGAMLTSVSLSPATVTGSASSIGTVALSTAAPTGGAVVTLTSSNTNAVTVPASVTVAAGATTATFTASTKPVTAGTTVTITATYNGASKTGAMVVNPLLASITLNPSVLTGGASSTGTVTLYTAAPAGGAVVTLTSNNTNAATIPASVTIAAGATSGTFSVTTKAVTAVTGVNVTATLNGASRTVTLVVNPPLNAVTVNPPSVVGGAGSSGTVTLSTPAPAGGGVVTLASSNTNAATVPASVTVAAGATTATFAIATKVVSTVSAVTITATYNAAVKTVTLVVNPPISLVTLNPAAVIGGAASTGTVTLGAAAPAGGAVVTLASNNTNAATVPASVTVAAGATTANFAIATKPVTTASVVTISAVYTGVTKTATLTVNPPAALGGVALNPAVVLGGVASTGTVTLGAAAPAGGAVVTLASNNINAATVPVSVTVAAGATTANFAIATKPVTTASVVTISAVYTGVTKTATLTVNPPASLAGVTLNPAAVLGGVASTGTVTLGAAAPAGGAVVTLASNNINAATVPVSVTVAAGATTANFAIATKPVTTASVVTISAVYTGVTKTATLTVNPPAALAGVTLNPAAVLGGVASTGTVTLGAAAPAGGAVVTLASNNTNAATVPASVTVVAGATTANFAITTKPVTTASAVTISAVYNGVTKTATLTVNPPASLAGVTLNPAAVLGGVASTGTVTLGAAAPAGGAVVTLASNNINAATVPVSVTVAAGATTANFAITTKPVTTASAVTISAAYNGVTKTATLTVNPPAVAALFSVSLNPAVVIFPGSATGTVKLTSAAPAGGAVVALASSDWANFYLPASVTVPAGATTAQFIVSTQIGRSTTVVTATYNGVNKTANLTSVYPTVAALVCNPNPVIAGNTTTCTVTMNGVMVEPTTVWVSSDQPFLAPANGTITIPAGATTGLFTITTSLVPDQIVAHISADALATATVTAPLTINLTNRGRKWVLNNVVFKDGGTANGYFTYDSATGQYLDANIQVTPGPDQTNPLGRPPENWYYYPWPNSDRATFVNNVSSPTALALQNPISDPYSTVLAWTYLQFNFAQALTNAGGTVALITNPNAVYSTFCADDLAPTCTRPPANISQEQFALPPLYPYYTFGSGFYYRVVVSGTITAQ